MRLPYLISFLGEECVQEMQAHGIVQGHTMRVVNVYKYIINRDYGNAYGALDSIHVNGNTYYMLHSAIDLRCGNYEQAYHNYVIGMKYTDSLYRQIQSADLAEHNILLGNERIKREAQTLEFKNTQLGLKNAQLELNHIKAQAELEKINTENGRLALENRNLELTRMNMESERQKTLLKEQQIAAQHHIELLSTVTGFLILLSGLMMIYFYKRRKSMRILRKKNDELTVARDHALEEERMKSMFFQNMNHEIRTPLNAIVGFNDLLNSEEMAEVLTPDDRREYIGLIHSNADLLTTLVNDVLDLSKFESGTYLMNITAVDVRSLCHDTLESVQMRAQSGVEVVFSPGEPGLIIDTDAQRLQQVLINFLTNACKYTEQGSVTLSYACVELPETKTIDGETLPAGSYVRFAVSDTGKGVPKGEEDSCFLRFQMLDKNVKGTRLGLHICRLILKMLHGRVYVDKEYTAGARFVFDHPVKQR